MAYGLRNRRMAGRGDRARVREAARMLQIADYLTASRVSFRRPAPARRHGRAVVRRPEGISVPTKPLSNLDAKLRGSMRVEIRRLQRSFGTRRSMCPRPAGGDDPRPTCWWS